MYETLEEAAWEARHQKVPTWYVSNPQTKTRIKLVGRPPFLDSTTTMTPWVLSCYFPGEETPKVRSACPYDYNQACLLCCAMPRIPCQTSQNKFDSLIFSGSSRNFRNKKIDSGSHHLRRFVVRNWAVITETLKFILLKQTQLTAKALVFERPSNMYISMYIYIYIHICIFVIETYLFGKRNYIYSSNTWDVNISCHYDIDIVDSNCLSMLYTVWINSRTREFGFYNVHHSRVLP